MKKIIKDAFVEGRETDVDWSDSEAKHNQNKLILFSENVSNFNGTEFNTTRAMERIDINSGEVLNFFPSRLDAAKWICTNVMKLSDKDVVNKKAISITGNMHMCISNGWKSYGSYWRYVSIKKHIKQATQKASKLNGRMIWVKLSSMTTQVFPSINEAASSLGVSAKRISTGILNNTLVDGMRFMDYNKSPVTMSFPTFTAAANYFGLSCRHAKQSFFRKRLNNIKVIVENKDIVVKNEIRVYAGNSRIGRFDTISAASLAYGSNRKQIATAIKTNTILHGRRYKKVNVIK